MGRIVRKKSKELPRKESSHGTGLVGVKKRKRAIRGSRDINFFNDWQVSACAPCDVEQEKKQMKKVEKPLLHIELEEDYETPINQNRKDPTADNIGGKSLQTNFVNLSTPAKTSFSSAQKPIVDDDTGGKNFTPKANITNVVLRRSCRKTIEKTEDKKQTNSPKNLRNAFKGDKNSIVKKTLIDNDTIGDSLTHLENKETSNDAQNESSNIESSMKTNSKIEENTILSDVASMIHEDKLLIKTLRSAHKPVKRLTISNRPSQKNTIFARDVKEKSVHIELEEEYETPVKNVSTTDDIVGKSPQTNDVKVITPAPPKISFLSAQKSIVNDNMRNKTFTPKENVSNITNASNSELFTNTRSAVRRRSCKKTTNDKEPTNTPKEAKSITVTANISCQNIVNKTKTDNNVTADLSTYMKNKETSNNVQNESSNVFWSSMTINSETEENTTLSDIANVTHEDKMFIRSLRSARKPLKRLTVSNRKSKKNFILPKKTVDENDINAINDSKVPLDFEQITNVEKNIKIDNENKLQVSEVTSSNVKITENLCKPDDGNEISEIEGMFVVDDGKKTEFLEAQKETCTDRRSTYKVNSEEKSHFPTLLDEINVKPSTPKSFGTVCKATPTSTRSIDLRIKHGKSQISNFATPVVLEKPQVTELNDSSIVFQNSMLRTSSPFSCTKTKKNRTRELDETVNSPAILKGNETGLSMKTKKNRTRELDDSINSPIILKNNEIKLPESNETDKHVMPKNNEILQEDKTSTDFKRVSDELPIKKNFTNITMRHKMFSTSESVDLIENTKPPDDFNMSGITPTTNSLIEFEENEKRVKRRSYSLSLTPEKKPSRKSSLNSLHTPKETKRANLYKKVLNQNLKSVQLMMPVRTKMPNFALIHQQAADKMEDIEQHQKRKAERAKLLMSGNKPKQIIKENESKTPTPKITENSKLKSSSKSNLHLTDNKFTPTVNSSKLKNDRCRNLFKNVTDQNHSDKYEFLEASSSSKSHKENKSKIPISNFTENSKLKSNPKSNLHLNVDNKCTPSVNSSKLDITEQNHSGRSGLLEVSTSSNSHKSITKPSSFKPVQFMHMKINYKPPELGAFDSKPTSTKVNLKPKNEARKDLIKAVATKTRVKKPSESNQRELIKGVRSNRRFELLMKMRQT